MVLSSIHLAGLSCILVFYGSNRPSATLSSKPMLRGMPIHARWMTTNWITMPLLLMLAKGFMRKLLSFMPSLAHIVWTGTTKIYCKSPVRKQNTVFPNGTFIFTMNQSTLMVVSLFHVDWKLLYSQHLHTPQTRSTPQNCHVISQQSGSLC